MPKFFEIVVIATIVGIVVSMFFENVKEYYMSRPLWLRLLTIAALLLLSFSLVYFGEKLPNLQGVEFTIPLPIPVFEKTTVTVKHPLFPSIIFGVGLTILSVGTALGRKSDLADRELSIQKYLSTSPVLVFPYIIFAYKFYVESDMSEANMSLFILLALPNCILALLLKYDFPKNWALRGLVITAMFLAVSGTTTLLALI